MTTDRFSGQEFQLVKCSQCGLVYLTPRPAQHELDKYYPDNYDAYLLPEQRRSMIEQWHSRRALRLKLDYIERFLPEQGQLLDIGCATGSFLNEARERGWKVKGLEVVDKIVLFAREYYHLEIITTSIEGVSLPAESIDAAVMWDVLEHLPSPRRALERIYNLLSARGMLFFSIPNLNSFDRYLFGRKWIGWDVPRHFNLFDSETIQILLKETGFQLVDQRCLLGGKGTFNLSLDRLLENKAELGWLRRIYPLLGGLLWPYRQLAYLFRRGPIMYYAVRKAD